VSNIRAVAELAGVSVATVSRALQQPERVSQKTRAKVLAAVRETGYKPNQMAVKFRSGKTHHLVALVPTVANLFFARVISGMQQAAHDRRYSLLLCNTLADEAVEQSYARMVDTAQADGVIQLRAFNPFTTHSSNEMLPMVNACEVLDDAPCPSVQLDNRKAAQLMTEHLLQLGHRRIAMIKGPARSPLTRDRLAGYRDALQMAGLSVDEQLLCPGNFSLQSGYDATAQLLALPMPPTAIFCENDEMALGALKCLKDQGIAVPAQVSVAGFDDIAFAQYCDPPLTTIAQPAEDFGRTAVNLLIDVLEQRLRTAPKVMLPFELVVRGSTGPAPRSD